MLYLTIILFAVAAIVGTIILKNWLTSSETSRTVIYAHGLFAALALVLLILIAFRSEGTALLTSVALFVIAALVGFYMFFRDIKGKTSPVWLAVTHGLVAFAGFLFFVIHRIIIK